MTDSSNLMGFVAGAFLVLIPDPATTTLGAGLIIASAGFSVAEVSQ